MENNQFLVLSWAFEHSSDGMLLTDTTGVIQKVNDAFVRMFGYSRDEVVGKRTNLLRSSSSTPEFYQEMWRSLGERDEWKGEIVNRAKDGKEKICFLTITSIKTPEGVKLGYLGVEIDLSERKQLEQRIAEGEKLASIGESLATLLHEIRNPLNGITMNIYMLEHNAEQESHWTEEERESIHLISKEVRRLEGLVKQSITYARKIIVNPERILVAEFLNEIRELLIFQAEAKDVSIEIAEVATNLSGYFDPDLMKQVMLNLLQNAVEVAERSAERSVRMLASIVEEPVWRSVSSSGKVLMLSVENTGEPIGEELAKNLFKPFFTTKQQGLGLGLVTSAKIVRKHHGIINHSNAEAPYSTAFTVALPL